jgi:uncharacterized protein DUF2849
MAAFARDPAELMPQMIIANRLIDGAVVFLAPGEQWVSAIDSGLVIEDEAEAQRFHGVAKQHEARCLVIDPLLIQVKVENGRVRPTEIREVIRAFGPTVRTDVTDDEPAAMPGLAPESGERRVEGTARVRKNTKE